jgi:hypothetical protein
MLFFHRPSRLQHLPIPLSSTLLPVYNSLPNTSLFHLPSYIIYLYTLPPSFSGPATSVDTSLFHYSSC